MQIVIDLPKETYKNFIDESTGTTEILQAVRHGTPLPEHHGRLIDADALWRKWVFDSIGKQEIDEAPTIIERSE